MPFALSNENVHLLRLFLPRLITESSGNHLFVMSQRALISDLSDFALEYTLFSSTSMYTDSPTKHQL